MDTQNTLWPVMLTPLTKEGAIDYPVLGELICWYEQNGADGLFAVCQSSEMFHISLRERVELAAFVKKHATVPVVASGHISSAPSEQYDELMRIAETGVDAVIMVTNRLADEHEPSSVWADRLSWLLGRLDPALKLGFYECPYPYKRLLSDDEIILCRESGRFYFIKDTCCDIGIISHRMKLLEGSRLLLYNANTATLLSSLKLGAAGFSGVMANFHPELYRWILDNWNQSENAEYVQAVLTVCSKIEQQLYPVNAKYHLNTKGLPITTICRAREHSEMTELFRSEVEQMDIVVSGLKKQLQIG